MELSTGNHVIAGRPRLSGAFAALLVQVHGMDDSLMASVDGVSRIASRLSSVCIRAKLV